MILIAGSFEYPKLPKLSIKSTRKMNFTTRNWVPAESEFFAENEFIEIIPNFRGDKLKFI